MDVCPFCGKAFKRLKSHLPHCKMAGAKDESPAGGRGLKTPSKKPRPVAKGDGRDQPQGSKKERQQDSAAPRKAHPAGAGDEGTSGKQHAIEDNRKRSKKDQGRTGALEPLILTGENRSKHRSAKGLTAPSIVETRLGDTSSQSQITGPPTQVAQKLEPPSDAKSMLSLYRGVKPEEIHAEAIEPSPFLQALVDPPVPPQGPEQVIRASLQKAEPLRRIQHDHTPSLSRRSKPVEEEPVHVQVTESSGPLIQAPLKRGDPLVPPEGPEPVTQSPSFEHLRNRELGHKPSVACRIEVAEVGPLQAIGTSQPFIQAISEQASPPEGPEPGARALLQKTPLKKIQSDHVPSLSHRSKPVEEGPFHVQASRGGPPVRPEPVTQSSVEHLRNPQYAHKPSVSCRTEPAEVEPLQATGFSAPFIQAPPEGSGPVTRGPLRKLEPLRKPQHDHEPSLSGERNSVEVGPVQVTESSTLFIRALPKKVPLEGPESITQDPPLHYLRNPQNDHAPSFFSHEFTRIVQSSAPSIQALPGQPEPLKKAAVESVDVNRPDQHLKKQDTVKKLERERLPWYEDVSEPKVPGADGFIGKHPEELEHERSPWYEDVSEPKVPEADGFIGKRPEELEHERSPWYEDVSEPKVPGPDGFIRKLPEKLEHERSPWYEDVSETKANGFIRKLPEEPFSNHSEKGNIEESRSHWSNVLEGPKALMGQIHVKFTDIPTLAAHSSFEKTESLKQTSEDKGRGGKASEVAEVGVRVADRFQGSFKREPIELLLEATSKSVPLLLCSTEVGSSTHALQESETAHVAEASAVSQKQETRRDQTGIIRTLERLKKTMDNDVTGHRRLPGQSSLGLQWFPELYSNYIQVKVVPREWDQCGTDRRTSRSVVAKLEHQNPAQAARTPGIPLASRRLMDIRIGELPSWLSLQRLSMRRIPEIGRRAWAQYYNKYINVKKGGAGGVAMLLAGYCALSYSWNFHHIRQDRWRKYH